MTRKFISGIAFGILWGALSHFIPERNDPFLVPMRILLLLVGGMVSVFGSELIGYGGAGPLACVASAFVSLVCWSKLGWEIEDNPGATAFEIFWMIFEPILFGITGASIKLNKLNGNMVSVCIGIIVAGILLRIVATVLLGIGCKLNLKEKLFVAISWMSKATVQVISYNCSNLYLNLYIIVYCILNVMYIILLYMVIKHCIFRQLWVLLF